MWYPPVPKGEALKRRGWYGRGHLTSGVEKGFYHRHLHDLSGNPSG